MAKKKTPFQQIVEKLGALDAREQVLKNELKEISRLRITLIVMLCGGNEKLLEDAWKGKSKKNL